MKRTGIIGLGIISQYYKMGLEQSSFLELVSVCDVQKNAASREIYDEFPFYNDYERMIEEEHLEYVVISTPPKTHYEIAKRCIELGVSVIVEKPAVTDKRQYDELLCLSEEKGVAFDVMYHFMTAPEMIGFKDNFDASKISSVRVEIMDKYSDDGKSINEQQREMCGAWLDSGSNALSMLACWFNLDNVQLLKHNAIRCEKTAEPLYVYVELMIDGIRTEIVVDWRKNINHKTAYLKYDGTDMEVSSTKQKIIYGQKEYSFAKIERLQAHYLNYFKNFKGESDRQADRSINNALLFINEAL